MSVSLNAFPIKTEINLSTNNVYALLVHSEYLDFPYFKDETFHYQQLDRWITARLAFYKRKHPYYYHRMQMRRNPDYEDPDI
jgi:hypothetical protein